MDNGQSKYRLESLEPRLLLSVGGLIDEAVVLVDNVSDPSTATTEYKIDGQFSISAQIDSSYSPEAQLSDLFEGSENGEEGEQDSEAQESSGESNPDTDSNDGPTDKTDDPFAAQKFSTAPVSDDGDDGADLAGKSVLPSESIALYTSHVVSENPDSSLGSLSPLDYDQSSTTDELVETLHAAQPPPISELQRDFLYKAEAGNNDFTLGLSKGEEVHLRLFDNVEQRVLASTPLEDIASVKIIGTSEGNDRLTVDFSDPFWLEGGIEYEGGAGWYDTLVVAGNSSISVDYTAQGTDSGIIRLSEGIYKTTLTFSGLEPVVISGAADYTFSTSDLSELFPIELYPTGIPADLTGEDHIVIDSPAAGQNRISGTSGGYGFEEVIFSGVTNLTINVGANDGAGGPADTITILGDAVENKGFVATGLQSVAIETGEGDDAVVFAASDFNLPIAGGALTVGFGSGADTLDLSALGADFSVGVEAVTIPSPATVVSVSGVTGTVDTVLGVETVLSGSGTDTVVGPALGAFWSLTGSGVVELEGVVVSGIENLAGGVAADVFAFTGGSVSGTVDGGAGSDTLDFSSYPTPVTVDLAAGVATDTGGIAGIENVSTGSGDDLLSGVLGAGVLAAGAGADTLDFSDVSAALTVNIHAGGTVSAAAGAESVSGVSGVENVVGGAGANSYVFEDGASLAGEVSGVGTTTLDYSVSTTPITVDPFNGTATGTGGVANVSAVVGGAATDTLVGPAAGATWTLTGADEGDVDGIGFQAVETLIGGVGNDVLIGADAANTWNITGLDAGSVAGIAFVGMESLTGGTEADVFVLTAGGWISGVIDGGGGLNTLDYSAYVTGIAVDLGSGTATGAGGISNIQNAIGSNANDTLTGDSAANSLVGGPGDDVLTGGQGADSLDGGVGADRLVEARDADVTLTDSTLTAGLEGSDILLSIEWASIAGGAGANTLDVSAFSGSVVLAGEGGDDLFIINNTDFTLDGGAGNDTLAAGDAVNVWELDGQDAGTLNGASFTSIENLVGGVVADTFIMAASALITGLIDGREGDDRLVGEDEQNAWTISGPNAGTLNSQDFINVETLVGGLVDDTFVLLDGAAITGSIDGGGGSNTLDYSLKTAGVQVDLASGTATGVAAVSSIQNVIGGAGPDIILGNDTDNSLLFSLGADFVDGRAGNDKLVGPNSDISWHITGLNTGTIGESTFQAIENLIGGSGADTFLFDGETGVSGTIAGGGGYDDLNYSLYSTSVTVDLSTGAATGAAGITGIENITGGAGDDTLIGDGADNILMGGPGIDTFAGGAGIDTLTAHVTETTWSITSLNAGTLDGQVFAEIENLVGAADNEDTFIFYEAGRISGVVEGGPRGFDSIILAEGIFENVNFVATGPDSGSIERDGDVITYAGLEPLVADSISATNVSLTFNDDPQTISIKDSGTDSDGQMTVVSSEGENPTFPVPTDSLTINAGSGADTIIVESLDNDFASNNTDLTINAGGGDDVIELQVLAGSGPFQVDGGGDTDTIVARRNADFTLSNTSLIMGPESVTLVGTTIERAYLTGGAVDASTFSGQVVSVSGIPEWTEQGPGAIAGGYARLGGDTEAERIVSGAIQAVATHPTNAGIIYAGTVNGGVWRTAGATVFFEFALRTLEAMSEEAEAAAKAILDEFAVFLAANPGVTVEVVGHTDSVGEPSFNNPLSQDRADAVVTYLTGKGIEAHRFTAIGRGEDLPVADNSTPEGRVLNRRVELTTGYWEPLTDQFPSLAISAITLDIDNPNVIYAGTGSFSAYSLEGGTPIGLLKSTDAGRSWELVGANELRGERVTSIVAKGNTVLVSTDTPTQAVHFYRSTDGGETFPDVAGGRSDGIDNDTDGRIDEVEVVSAIVAIQGNNYAVGDKLEYRPAGGGYVVAEFAVTRITGGAATGPAAAVRVAKEGEYNPAQVPSGVSVALDTVTGTGSGLQVRLGSFKIEQYLNSGKITDLVAEKLMSGDLRVYAALPGKGIYRSDDSGIRWTKINSDLPAVVVSESTRIRLALSTAGTHPIYAVFIKGPYVGSMLGRISGIYRSTDQGGSWALMDRPGDANAAIVEEVGVGFTKETADAKTPVTGDVTLLPGGNDADRFYIGIADRFDSNTVIFDIGTAGEGTYTLSWEYSTGGGGWNALTVADETDNFKEEGVNTVTWNAPADWAEDTVDSEGPFYYVRTTADAGTRTTPPVADQITILRQSLHKGNQGGIHFSIVADPNHDNVAFIGGDTSPQTHAGVYTGRLFRGDASAPAGSQWQSIVNAAASNTAPHPDSRDMEFDAQGNILQVDDGGIYKLINPNDDATHDTDGDSVKDDREWVSLINNLRLTEFLSVAYDPINDVIIGGAQDNGVVLQSAEGSRQWTTLRGGDGRVVQVAIDGGQSTMYFSTQRLGGFQKITNADPATSIRLALEVDGSGWFDDVSLLDLDPRDGKSDFERSQLPFTTQHDINAVDPNHFMIGTRFIYWTDPDIWDPDTTADFDAHTDLDVWGGASGDGPAKEAKYEVGTVISLAYGGFEWVGSTRTGKNDSADVGTANGELYVRRDGEDSFEKTDWGNAGPGKPGGPQPVDLVLHPDDWKQVFVIASNKVWYGKLNDTGGTPVVEYDWTDLTGRLGEIASKLRTIELFKTGTGASANDATDDTAAILVGGLGGVFKTSIDLSTLTPGGSPDLIWSEYGAGLPNILVTDLRYDSLDDILLAGTLGRGAWTVKGASETLALDSVLRIVGHATDNDTVRLVRDQTKPWLLNVFLSESGGGISTVATTTLQLSSISTIEIDGRGGNDTIQIEGQNGPIAVPNAVEVDDSGVNAADVLKVENHIRDRNHNPASKIPAPGVDGFQRYEFDADDLWGKPARARIQTKGVENLPQVAILGSGQIQNATKDAEVLITTVAPHRLVSGHRILIEGVGGMTELNGREFTITVVGPGLDTFRLNSEDGTGYGTYTSSGTWRIPNHLAHTADSTMQGGMESMFGSSQTMMASGMSSTSLAVVDPGTLASGLSGTLIQPEKPLEDPSVDVVQITPDGVAQVDTGGSFLSRFFEEGPGGFNLIDVIAQGPAAFRDALQGLDPDGSVSGTGWETGTWDNVRFDVELTKELNGIVGLDVLGQALVEQIGITDVADALSDAIQFDGAMEFSANVTVNLVFGTDVNGFFIEPDAGQPEIVISSIRIAGDAVASGRFGFLAVELGDLNLQMEDGVELRLDLFDPETEAADGYVRPPELVSPLPTSLFSVALSSPGTPETPDVSLSATLNVILELPGFSLSLAETSLTLSWDSIDDSTFSVVAGGVDVAHYLSFLKLRPDQVLGKLRDLRDKIDEFAESIERDIPFMRNTLDQVLNVVDSFDQRILSQLDLSPAPSFDTVQGLASVFAASLTDLTSLDEIADEAQREIADGRNVLRTIEDLGFSYDPASSELTYQVNAEAFFDTSQPFDFGFDADADGAMVNVAASVGLDLTFGVDIGLLTSGSDLSDVFFIRNSGLTASVEVSATDLTASSALGPIEIAIDTGTVTAAVSIAITLADPETTVTPESTGRIDLRELISGLLGDPVSLIEDVDISGSASITGLTLSVADFIILSGSFAFENTSGDLRLNDGTLFDAVYQVISAEGIDGFAGVNGPFLLLDVQ
jgi:hypothetical protein